MSIPVIGLINSRQIVCSVTKMNMNKIPKTTLWYLLFPLNRAMAGYLTSDLASTTSSAPIIVKEDQLALFIFIVTLARYSHFAIGTVKQICNALDIWCFSIKSEKDKLK
jgi:hypothetical protein